ncbi:MAG: C40 family peptidase [Pseudomonadota bacterium]
MSDGTLDPRLHAYRPDVAAKHLEGQVTAKRFIEGEKCIIIEPLADIMSNTIGEARTSQALYGERFTVYDRQDHWVWGQLETDGYVGWVSAYAAGRWDGTNATHKVSATLTRATSGSIKVIGDGPLPLGARLRVTNPSIEVGGSSAPFAETDAGAVPSAHIAPIDDHADDWVAVAETFLGVPYVWGGRSPLGLDCSALVQLALDQAGIACLRDSDMQEETLGKVIDRSVGLARGDLVFWPGHVGIMIDATSFLHANAFAMATAVESLSDVEARIGTARTVKRL